MNGGRGGVGRTEGSAGYSRRWQLWGQRRSVGGDGKSSVRECVCVCVRCLFLLFPAGYFKHSFLGGCYHIAVSPLCWTVRGSLLSLESSSILPGRDRYMSEWKL